jgi:RNA polymerase sigma-70 factor (ECF subfamily)
MSFVDPDTEVIAAVLAGEHNRFDEIARRYSGALWRMAYSRLGLRDAADDVLQETLLAAFRWLSSYDSRYSFRTWLWTILLNECRRSLAKRSRRREVSSHELAAAGELANLTAIENPQESLLLRERAETLERLLRRLPEPEADALRLRFFGELKFHEIAQVMGCSLSTAKYRVRDGLAQLSLWLGADDVPLTAARDENPQASLATRRSAAHPHASSSDDPALPCDPATDQQSTDPTTDLHR